ncbi:hypothetical protein B9Z65_80 [Elsinoe australis]|uniref:Uncharacterized protein n=1 Tax=Elsinoe australis TaxID=40998 RepID=A0A2P7ZKD1_9PEZI|nr:hypothetical protein B9Z65_80 [Elsinoe australis]
MSDTKSPPRSPSDSGSDNAAEAMIKELQERLVFVLDPLGYANVSNKVVAQLARLAGLPCDECLAAIRAGDPHHPTSTTAPEINVAADPVLIEMLSNFKEYIREAEDDGVSEDIIGFAARHMGVPCEVCWERQRNAEAAAKEKGQEVVNNLLVPE